jgi:hypothetical protein
MIRKMYEAMTVPALKVIARRMQIGRLSERRKAELIDTIEIMYVVDQERALAINNDPAKLAVMRAEAADPGMISIALTFLAIDEMRVTLAARGVDTTGMTFHELGTACRETERRMVEVIDTATGAPEQVRAWLDRHAVAEITAEAVLAARDADHDEALVVERVLTRNVTVPARSGECEASAFYTRTEHNGPAHWYRSATSRLRRRICLAHVNLAEASGLRLMRVYVDLDESAAYAEHRARAAVASGAARRLIVLEQLGERVGEDLVPLAAGDTVRWDNRSLDLDSIRSATDGELTQLELGVRKPDSFAVETLLARLRRTELELARSRATLLKLRAQMVLSA